MKRLPDEVSQIITGLDVSDETLQRISLEIEKEFQLGLEYGKTATSSIAMLPSFVPKLPDGTETGKYVAIDLSGKNLRIVLLSLKGRGVEPEVIIHNFIVHDSVMKGTGDQLFNFIVNCLHKFLAQHDLVEANLPIGFVFSYPCELLSIRSARLLWWTKGFDIKDCLQQDVVQLLEDALEMNMTIKARVKAVMNDTVGQLAAAAYKYGPECTIGVVIGYGCNSSYLEDVRKIKKFNAQRHNYKHDTMVVVTEWEEFGAKGELEAILTPYDKEIDMASVHKGKQIVDKLTGALYLGELVRRMCAQLCVDGVLFSGQMAERLQIVDGFPAKYISEILTDSAENNYNRCRRILDEMEVPSHGHNDYLILKELCHAVSKRSAAIAASAIAALLRHVDRPVVKIGVGGALVQFHPTYMDLLNDRLNVLAPKSCAWELVPADEGSAKGAALIAAVVDKMKL